MMILDFGEARINVQIDDASLLTSRHSGATLSRLLVSFRVRGRAANESTLELIGQAQKAGVTSLDENGEVEKRWKIGNTSWSYQEGQPIYRHSLQLEETEELKATALVIDDLTAVPYEYEESFHGDDLGIEAKVAVTEQDHLLLKEMLRSRNNVQVTRHGISDQPREMQLGLCYWSKHDSEYRYSLYIGDVSERDSPLASAFAWMRPLRRLVAQNALTLRSLTSVLVAKGILAEDEVPSVSDEVTDDMWDILFEFFRVDDVDNL